MHLCLNLVINILYLEMIFHIRRSLQTWVDLFHSRRDWSYDLFSSPLCLSEWVSQTWDWPTHPPTYLWVGVMTTVKHLPGCQREGSKELSLQFPGLVGHFEWKAFYALLEHVWHSFHVLAGTDECTTACCINPAQKTLLPSRIRSLLLKSAW